MDTSIPALSAVRTQVNAIRTTLVHHIERELRFNANPDWPELVNSFQVVARQLADLSDDIDPVLQFFAFQPVRATSNPSHIPIFLSTRPLAEMEATSAEMTLSMEDHHTANIAEDDDDVLEEYNRSVQLVEDAYESASQRVLSNLFTYGSKSRPSNA